MQLPPSLRERIEILLDGVSTQELSLHYQNLSERYRRQCDAGSLQIRNHMEALAYVTSRLPATYAAVTEVCTRLRRLWPDFHPRALVDLGAGPGTATLAALDAWDQIEDLTLIEPNPYLAKLARELIAAPLELKAAPLQVITPPPADLVLASYVLNEVSAAACAPEIDKIWPSVTGALILIEPGTPLGYETVLAARKRLIELGAYIAAPCPHTQACPLENTGRWCHFSERIDRSTAHRRVKGDASLGYEDEKFSYLVATRRPVPLPQARLIGRPHGTKIIQLEVCTDKGRAETIELSKRDSLYKPARKADWGDALGENS